MVETCGHDHGEAGGLKGGALAQALTSAEDRCARAGERLTTPRRRVLEMLLELGQPAKAYDLIAAFGADGRAAKPPTVYRALDFLERAGLAHRIASLSAYVACGHGEDAHTAAFLICDCCGDTREIAPAGLDVLQSAATRQGYTLDRVAIEAHGRCSECA